MAWEICMSAEGWANVSRNVYAMPANRLVEAIVDHEFEVVEDTFSDNAEIDNFVATRKQFYAGTPQDILAAKVMELISENNTCDNGGHAVWIDKEGYHTVPVALTPEGEEYPLEAVC